MHGIYAPYHGLTILPPGAVPSNNISGSPACRDIRGHGKEKHFSLVVDRDRQAIVREPCRLQAAADICFRQHACWPCREIIGQYEQREVGRI